MTDAPEPTIVHIHHDDGIGIGTVLLLVWLFTLVVGIMQPDWPAWVLSLCAILFWVLTIPLIIIGIVAIIMIIFFVLLAIFE